jgi:hypothetical protein
VGLKAAFFRSSFEFFPVWAIKRSRLKMFEGTAKTEVREWKAQEAQKEAHFDHRLRKSLNLLLPITSRRQESARKSV